MEIIYVDGDEVLLHNTFQLILSKIITLPSTTTFIYYQILSPNLRFENSQ